MAAEAIAAGWLVPLLEEWAAPFPGFFCANPAQRQMAPALRAFIDTILFTHGPPPPSFDGTSDFA